MSMRVEDRLREFDQPQLAALNTRLLEIARTLGEPEDYCLLQILADCMGQVCRELLSRAAPREVADRIWRESTTN